MQNFKELAARERAAIDGGGVSAECWRRTRTVAATAGGSYKLALSLGPLFSNVSCGLAVA
jgi:hypothetical protein